MLAALLIGTYFFFKLFIAIHIVSLVGETRVTKQLIEMSIFLALSAYLLRILRELLYSREIRKIRENAKEAAINMLSNKSRYLRQKMQQFNELGATQDNATQKLSFGIELQIVSQDLDRVESISVDSQFYQSLNRLPTASFILGVASFLLGILNFIRHP